MLQLWPKIQLYQALALSPPHLTPIPTSIPSPPPPLPYPTSPLLLLLTAIFAMAMQKSIIIIVMNLVNSSGKVVFTKVVRVNL